MAKGNASARSTSRKNALRSIALGLDRYLDVAASKRSKFVYAELLFGPEFLQFLFEQERPDGRTARNPK